MSTMQALRAATWGSHQRLEKGLDIKARFATRTAYRHHLQQMWGFCAAIEGQLSVESFGGALPDYESRRKLPLLTQDLSILRADMSVSLPLPRNVPSAQDPSAAFGCAYVLEGATLGGRILLPVVEDRLGFTAAHGAAFLASYGERVPSMWQSFAAALNAWCGGEMSRQAIAIGAASEMFDTLSEWLRDTAEG